MRTCRILFFILQFVLLMHGFGMSQETNVCNQARIDSIVDAKVQQVLVNNVERYVETEANKIYQKHDNDMKDWYAGLGILIGIVCVLVTIAGTLSPYINYKQFEKRLDKKEEEVNDLSNDLKMKVEKFELQFQEDYNKKMKDINQIQAMVLYNRAIEKRNNITERIELCKSAIEYSPDFFLAYKLLGAAYFLDKKYKEAITYYTKALEIDKDDETFVNRALAYSKLGEHKNAIDDYDNAIRLNPKYANAYYNKARKLFNMGEQHDEAAREAIREALKLKETALYYGLSCNINERLGSNNECLEDWKTALNDAQKGFEISTPKPKSEFFSKKIEEYKKKIDELGGKQ